MRTALALSFLVAVALQAPFEPARLETGELRPVELMSTGGGMVIVEIDVDARGSVGRTNTLKDVAPFTEVALDSVRGWRFQAASDNRVRVESSVLVIGLFRPAALLFPLPELPKPPTDTASTDVPFPTGMVVPPYPPNRIGGANVLVEVDVDARGNVGSVRTLSPESGFDDSALSTARSWKFRAAERNGKPVDAIVYMIVSYREPVG